MDKELKTQVQQLVDDLFNDKEEATIRKRTEDELQKAASSITELTTALEDKNAEFVSMEEKMVAAEEKVSTSEARIKELESELEAARKELETATAKTIETEKKLEEINKDRAAELRMAGLEDAGVARTKDREAQVAKIRNMSDEEFASYKDELISIRESVVKELEKAKQQAEEEAKVQAEKDAIAAASAASDNEGVPPAQIPASETTQAALNLEVSTGEGIEDKYKNLGKAMAARFNKK